MDDEPNDFVKFMRETYTQMTIRSLVAYHRSGYIDLIRESITISDRPLRPGVTSQSFDLFGVMVADACPLVRSKN